MGTPLLLGAGGYQAAASNVVLDYQTNTWSLKSFQGDASNNIFSGDATSTTIINNAITASNDQFSMDVWVKRTAAGATQFIACRDKSSATTQRQFVLFFNSTNNFQANFYTNSTNFIAFTSTATITETREWNHFVVVYDGTQSATSRITVYRNGLAFAGTTSQTGTMGAAINSSGSIPVMNILGRSDAASSSNIAVSSFALFNTNLSAANVTTLYNNRVPFDIRTNTTLNASLVMYLVADKSATFSSNWTWTDLVGGAVFTSSGMVEADQISDAPALKIVSVVMLHGQSNASGREPMANLNSQYQGDLQWLKVWNGTTFVDINSTLNNNQYSDTYSNNEFGIEYKLGDLLNRNYSKTVYVFKQVQGGSYLANTAPSWSSNPIGAEFTQLSTDLTALKEWELAGGYTINKMRFVWIQGEADSLTLANANAYQTKWTNWLTGAANSVFDTKIQQIFFTFPYLYDCLLSANQTLATLVYKSTVNTAKINVQATNTTYYRTINTDAATVDVDQVHYNKAGLETIATAVYNAIVTDGF